MESEDVINKIKAAFYGVVLGDGIGLWEAQAIDDYATIEVQKNNREKDEKDDWTLLKPEILQRCNSSLSFFDAKGMRFHLPAFIIASLENKGDDQIFHLTQLDDYAKSKLVSLSYAQKEAIIMYLNWCLEQDEYTFEHPTIERVVNEYWNT